MLLIFAFLLPKCVRKFANIKKKQYLCTKLYLQFCDLVVAHYKEERNVNYYAELLGFYRT